MKHTLKKSLALILAVLMVVLCAPLAFAASGTDGGITWSCDSDSKTLTIGKNNNGDFQGIMKDYGDGRFFLESAAPWYHYKMKIRTAVIEDGVENISSFAFAFLKQLESVSIAASVTSIGVYAFSDCSSLKTITIPRSVTKIGDLAFTSCNNLKTINYTGSEADWNKISFGTDVFLSASANKTFNYYYGVEGAMNAISDIGNVVYTAACKARINAARAAYDRLSDQETTLVTNHDALLKAEADYAALESRTDTGKALQFGDRCAVPNLKGAQQSNVYFGNYMQSNRDSKDPVKWRVLSNADGKLFLLADQNLDVMCYNLENTSVTWETCTLRSWLNGYGETANDDGADYTGAGFIDDAFAAAENAAIAVTDVMNPRNLSYPHVNSGAATADKVFLLSIAEAKNTAYGFTNNNYDTDTRVATNTAYVTSGGHTGSGMNAADEADWWWLRSPGENANYSSIVFYAGYLRDDGDRVDNLGVAVRPALNVDLGKVLFTSAAAGGKDSVGGRMTKIDDYTGSDWKLTLLDESRNFAVVEKTATCAPGCSFSLNFTGAKPGSNEYISAILVDENGSPVYYTRLGKVVDSDAGTVVTLPEDLSLGNYTLKVFNEQYNGDYKTDYASAFCDVAVTVIGELDFQKILSIEALEERVDPADYRDAQKTELEKAISDGTQAINEATTPDDVAYALEIALSAVLAIKTDAELTAEELDAAKFYAKDALDNYVNADDYRADEQAALANAIRDGKAAIDAAADTDAVASALAAAKAAIDDIKTDAELTEEELAADQAAADAVEAKIAAIGEVAYTDESKALIDAAQNAFDALTDAQKQLVENADVLTAAAEKYAELKAAAETPTEPTEPTDGDVCLVCGQTAHATKRDQTLHALLVFLRALIIDVILPLMAVLAQ